MAFSDRLRDLRKGKNLSQKTLADMAGVSQASIYHWEKGCRKPKMEQLYRLAEALDASVSDLIEPDVLQLSEDVIELFAGSRGIELSSDHTEIAQLYDSLNKKGQEKAIEQVELLTRIPEYQKKD